VANYAAQADNSAGCVCSASGEDDATAVAVAVVDGTSVETDQARVEGLCVHGIVAVTGKSGEAIVIACSMG
jgi:hypothetical protein